MDDRRRPSIFSVPLTTDLTTELARRLMAEFAADPVKLADVIILLPTNRARAALTEAFVRQSDGGILLPRFVVVGDPELDETLATFVDPIDYAKAPIIPPAIDTWTRRFLLTSLVRKQRPALSAVEALRLASLLARTIDQLDVEEITPSQINADQLEGELARHWNRAYHDFLELMAAHNRAVAAMGLLAPSARRNLLLDRLSACLSGPIRERFVIAAGISTTAPAVVRLLRTVSHMPNGQIVLPYVDQLLSDEDWQAICPTETADSERPKRGEETHPQYQLKLLLDKLAIERSEIVDYSAPGSASPPHLAASISAIFASPRQSENWSILPAAVKKLPKVRALVAEDSAEEALAIAILIRRAIEVPEKRVALITPDRELAVRTATHLKRWGIDVDDSAGTPLAQTLPGTLLTALIAAIAQSFSPVTLLALLKHPLVYAGDGRMPWLNKVRQLDLALRGPRLGMGLTGIGIAVRSADKSKSAIRELSEWWDGVVSLLRPLESIQFQDFESVFTPIVDVMETLSAGGAWKGEAGRKLAQLLEHIAGQDATAFGDIGTESLPTLFAHFLDGEVVRPAYGKHPRIAIWGLLEARLQSADVLICGSLNEGQWPQHGQPDPWLAPQLRHMLQLPGTDRNIGLSALDLASALGAPEVVLTRAKRDRSGPTNASRFWLRIEALLGNRLNHEREALMWARMLDNGPRAVEHLRPEPDPTAEQRRVNLSVTQVERLKTDPYAFYAQKILRLDALRSPGTDPDAAWRGTVIHDLLEQWAKQDACAAGALLARCDALFASDVINPVLRGLWQPRIRRALAWTEEEIHRQSSQGRTVLLAEEWGSMQLSHVTLKGKVDRIDRLSDGSLAIVDYKTGGAPSKTKIASGFAPQLGLLGLIARESGFNANKGIPTRFEYWSMAKDGSSFGRVSSALSKNEDGSEAAMQLVDRAKDTVLGVIARWIEGDEPFTAKLHPEYAVGSDYDQLMRLKEWYGREGQFDDG